MLTKKDYKAIAAILKDARPNLPCFLEDLEQTENSVINCIVNSLGDYFAQNDLNFDRDRFIEACR